MSTEKLKIINIPLLVNIFIAILFSGFLGLGFFYILKTMARQSVSVIGTSSTVMTNQIASYSISIEAINAQKTEAVKEVTEKSKAIVQTIKDFGIPDADIETTNLNIYQRQDSVYKDGTTTYAPGDWTATYTVNAKLRDLTRSDEFTALLASVDKASMWGPNLSIDNKTINEEELLKTAIDDARSKAQAIAVKVGKKVGKVLSIEEAGASSSYLGAVKMDGMGGGAGIPVEPGSTETYKSVVVVFELK